MTSVKPVIMINMILTLIVNLIDDGVVFATLNTVKIDI